MLRSKGGRAGVLSWDRTALEYWSRSAARPFRDQSRPLRFDKAGIGATSPLAAVSAKDRDSGPNESFMVGGAADETLAAGSRPSHWRTVTLAPFIDPTVVRPNRRLHRRQ